MFATIPSFILQSVGEQQVHSPRRTRRFSGYPTLLTSTLENNCSLAFTKLAGSAFRTL